MIFLLLIVNLVICVHSHAQTPVLEKNQSHFAVESNYYTTSGNFDSLGGSFEDLPAKHSYQRLGFIFRYDHALGTNSQLLGQLDTGYAESEDGVDKRTNSEVSEFHLGVQYNWRVEKWLSFSPLFTGVITTAPIDKSTEKVLTSEGVNGVKAGVSTQLKLGRFKLQALTNYFYRDDGRSDLFEYNVGLDLNLSSWTLNAHVSGFESVTDDEEFDTPNIRYDVANRVNGSSLKYYSVNPQVLTVGADAGYSFANKTALFKIGFDQDINGRNYAKGTTVLISAQWLFEKVVSTQDRDVDVFQVEDDGYDESLFKDVSRPKKVPKKKTIKKKSSDEEDGS